MSETTSTAVAKTQPGTLSTKQRSTRHMAVALTRLIGLNTEETGQQATLLQRADQRSKRRAEQYQLNVESVLNHALNFSDNSLAGHEPDPDWMHQFLMLSEQIHSSRMQEMWGRILATELGQPGAFSLRSLECLRRMTQRDALLLARAVALSCTLNAESSRTIVLGYSSRSAFGGLVRSRQPQLSLSRFGLPYSAILSLREQGILYNAELETGVLEEAKPLRLRFINKTLLMTPKHDRLRLRYYRFTPLGQELARLAQDHSDPDYIAALSKLVPRDFDTSTS
ncbi:TIGR03899 family protein [Ferrimonas marina]|uniref:TIGR03899 family protein n=1 Tax=Ferrimonas marina TaxID=299255 RepID=A0A1M5X1P4_9GAMM|nr:TIGR03899 family protein [Ferrimonas marina]SHH93113.1 TIGR03899 family protein [Ferrimonas marina]